MTADEKVNILMVDDQPAKLLSYEVILADLGENLIKATSAREALNLLLKTDVAVVLMDVSMPELDGFELADMIRNHPRFNKTAIIFISGVHLTDTDKINGYRRGAVDYISVPVIPEVLRSKIGVFVDLHRKTRQLERLNTGLERIIGERTEELRRSEAQHRERAELLELATEAIVVRDLSGPIRYWNCGAENLYGWKRDEVYGRDLHDLLRTVFPTSREETERDLLATRSWEGNLRVHSKDGRELVVATRKVLNHEGDGVLEIQRDITAQLQAEDALRQSEKLAAMGRVAGIIAHEINNPLEAITNAFYLLRNHPSLDEEARYYAALAEQELQRVSHITRQTLSFYRESRQPITVSVPDLLDNVVELQQRPIAVNQIRLEKKYLSQGVIRAFPGELRQVFLNLIGNAIQAMPSGGTLRLRVADILDPITQRRGITISVTDTGSGIGPEEARRIFQPFFSTKGAKGTGLGLWISRGIVQKYEGRIAFRTLRSGAGESACTCFRVFLPIIGDVGTPPGREQDVQAASGVRAIA
ncbi:MAG TPA: ATP-binding protein [Acidobacteriaceae bacterium]|nr:ATP-binding protein [Acidobacteriaceae bacterium]